ncbi:MAG: hypothetical protein ISS78_12575 [Phycisphaerae bacterium]|nr:hypothetical protein [Phycisphaerae bacterium]
MIDTFLPMLAVSGEPFDSPEHLFEMKWDGVRAVAAVEEGGYRIWGRDLADYGPRYPELELLRRLPSGTALDGELVVLQNGRAGLEAILHRHQLAGALKIKYACRQFPVTYVLFDLVYWQGRPLFHEPLCLRRARLEELVRPLQERNLVFSEGILGPGRQFFEQVVAQGHEGVMAKHVQGRYLPGRRMSAWRKIKPRGWIPCAIVGYTAGRSGVHSLLVAAPCDGVLQYVGQLTSGLSDETRARLGPLLAERTRPKPVIACPKKAIWVEPDLFCKVQFLRRTRRGRLREASFRGLIQPTG